MPTAWVERPNAKPATWGAMSVSERPNCAVLIGAIVGAWSFAESMLAWYYADLVSGPRPYKVAKNVPHLAAFESFDLLISYKQRVRMLKAAAERRELPPKVLTGFSDRLKALQDSYDDRIKAAHGRWGIDEAYPTGLVWRQNMATRKPTSVYEPADFQKSFDDLMEAHRMLHGFYTTEVLPLLESGSLDAIGDGSR